MDREHQDYIKKMRQDGVKDDEIRKSLTEAGWREDEIETAFKFANSGKPLPPPPPHAMGGAPGNQAPIAVVQRYTTVGMEYSIMFVALFFAAVSLGTLLHSQLDKLFGVSYSFGNDTMPAVIALVTVPIFLTLFIRLRGKENSEPNVKGDSSRRRGVQFALLVSFVWGIWSIIFYLYQLLSQQSYYSGVDSLNTGVTNQLLQFMHLTVTLAIAGGIFAYYWIDEHRHNQ